MDLWLRPLGDSRTRPTTHDHTYRIQTFQTFKRSNTPRPQTTHDTRHTTHDNYFEKIVTGTWIRDIIRYTTANYLRCILYFYSVFPTFWNQQAMFIFSLRFSLKARQSTWSKRVKLTCLSFITSKSSVTKSDEGNFHRLILYPLCDGRRKWRLPSEK